MVRLSVNINKIATIRNARGGNTPDLIKMAQNIERFGAQGITVHPRPDERHIRYKDVYDLKKVVQTEFNIEGNPTETKFIDLVLDVIPEQVTLVPDSGGQLTSDHGWDTIEHALETGTDRIELYTESYATNYLIDKHKAIAPFTEATKRAVELGLGLNAGHDLSLDNLKFFRDNLPGLQEVSIGHALISDALQFGMENTVQLYLRELK